MHRRWIFVFVFTLLTLSNLPAFSSPPTKARGIGRAPSAEAAVVTSEPSKVDAALGLFLGENSRVAFKAANRAMAARVPFAFEQEADGKVFVPVFVESTNTEQTTEAIREMGGRVSVVIKNILVARVPIDTVMNLSERQEVLRIEASYRSKTKLDVSRREVRADSIHSGAGLPGSFTGRGVVVGIIDSGIDVAHPDFKDASNRSRILSVWDMSREGKPPAGFTHGWECTNSEITAGQCPERDLNGHGTHVAGIAVGNGRGRPGSPFSGIAPEADIIFVKGWRETGSEGSFGDTDVIEGCQYILNRAASAGKPAVINLSLGGHLSPHDGSSLYEETLSGLLGAGKHIVTANGNEGDERIHLGYTIKGNSYQTGWSTYWKVEQGSGVSVMDIWTDSGSSLIIGILARDSTGRVFYESPEISSGRTMPRTSIAGSSGPVGFLEMIVQATPSGSKHAQIGIDNNDNPNIDLSKTRWEFYTYGSGRMDAWIPVGGEFGSESNPTEGFIGGDFNMTVGTPATARNVIAVGSYVTKINWTDVDGRARDYSVIYPNDRVGKLSSFSSLGPTRDNRVRPHVSAPGQGIASVLSEAVDANVPINRFFFLSGGGYQIMQGTSQAAPHVTGAVALMLQAKPTLTIEEAYGGLRGKARKDAETGAQQNNSFGDGKLDALEAIKTVATGTPTGPCVANSTTICLSNDRFKVQVQWTFPDGRTGAGQAVRLTRDTGYFWWENSDNVEVIVKMVNACAPPFNRHWVFAAGLTNVKVDLTITDSQTGATWTRTNPLNTAFQPIQDTNAFACP